jgi:hypothetical protein
MWFTDYVPVAHMKFRQHMLAQSVVIGSSKTSLQLGFFVPEEEEKMIKKENSL